jgi:hypothetical protein
MSSKFSISEANKLYFILFQSNEKPLLMTTSGLSNDFESGDWLN